MIDFKNLYNQQDFLAYLIEYYPDFEPKKEELQINKKFKFIKSVTKLGKSKKLDVDVYEIEHVSENDPRVTLSKEAFSILREYIARKSLVIFKNENTQNYRLSLITFQSTWESGNKITTEFSNPRRHSFFLGPDAKVKTPTRFLIDKGKIIDFEDLKNRFSLEVVNKEFYRDISEQFIKLVGGSLSKGKKKIEYQPLLKLPSISDKSQKSIEFAVRLIGRVIFCWFLREKKSLNRKSLVPKDLLSYEAIEGNSDYYHKILEPIFFEILNKQIKTRGDEFSNDLFSSIPYLNGGLFSPQDDDFYKRNSSDFQSQYHNNLIIPDQWFTDFFEVLETYNFTIDENTSFDEELSIDPEMLGRIFENLLAEINPETGESARKSTGSYYTPRVIVDYMVDESLLLYLKEQTKIDETKLRAIISYDLDDDINNPTKDEEKQKIVNALEKVKILDPACGSGAFPIGALQKIVFILQQIDPNGKLWKEKQLAKADPEFRKDIEKRFSNKEYNFIRKLGIIRDCIYGIDIQPIATEISRLRCFLTLIVDEQVDDTAENRGIKPLPNLDFKFVTANSLIGLPKVNEPQGTMFDDYQKIDELKKIRDEYFNSSGIEREQFKTGFSEKQNELINELITKHDYIGYAKADLTRKLTSWKPFKHISTDWFDPEWMFGIKDGFDIVIGNPPYVSVKNISAGDKKSFSNLFETGKGRFNLFTLFLEKGQKLLNSIGVLSYILPEVLYTNSEYKYIRKYLLKKTRIFSISNFSSRVFEASVDTSVIVIENGYSQDSKIKVLLDLNSFVTIINQSEINDIILTKNPNNIKVILDKINFEKERLSNIIEVQQGIIYSGQKKEDVFSNIKVDDTYKKILDGRDIQRYFINYGQKQENRYIKYTRKLHRPREERLFLAEEKLIFPRRSTSFICTIDKNKFYLLNTAYICLLTNTQYSLRYILGILNSKIINFLYSKTYIGWQITIPAINQIPIPKITNENIRLVRLIEKLVDQIILTKKGNPKIDTIGFEKQIDQMVYNLYELTKEEIAVVEKS